MGDMDRCVQRLDDGDRFVTRRIAGELIVVPVSGNVGDLEAIYTLNEVGAFVWQLLDGRKSAQVIADAVCAEYDVARDQAARDVDDLLGVLEARGLVRRLDEARRE